MTIKNARKLLWCVVWTCLLLTWLPYLGFFNSPVLVAGLPMALALTLGCNLILTLCVLAIYPLYFKPFMAALEIAPVSEEGARNE